MLEHRFAQLCAAATFLLLIVGGTVNATGSSLACPEPTLVCRGELFPEMTGGVLYEHGHRLVAMTVGFLQIALTVLLWRRRPTLRWLGVAALGMVCLQGALGAITVAYKLPIAVSMSHLMLAMAYFATLIYIAWRTRPAGVGTGDDIGRARRWIVLAGAVVLAQIFLGGLVRHSGGALACIDLPLCHGALVPDGAPPALVFHMIHRVGGVIVGLVAIASAVAVFRAARPGSAVRVLALAAPVLVLAQIGLGVATILSFRATPIAVAHFAGAAALWCLWATLFVMTGSGARAPAAAGETPELGRLGEAVAE